MTSDISRYSDVFDAVAKVEDYTDSTDLTVQPQNWIHRIDPRFRRFEWYQHDYIVLSKRQLTLGLFSKGQLLKHWRVGYNEAEMIVLVAEENHKASFVANATLLEEKKIRHGLNNESDPAKMLAGSSGWLPLDSYDPAKQEMVQVLCHVLDSNDPDGILSIGDHTVGDLFVSIGFLSEDEKDDGEAGWRVAGWCMYRDHFTDAKSFEVIAWQPLAQPMKGLPE